MIIRILTVLIAGFFLHSCGNNRAKTVTETDLTNKNWPEIEQQARGSTVRWMMWQGDVQINKYVQEYVAPALKQQYDINLEVIPGQGTEIVKTLMAEKEAGRKNSSVDLCWINGETFFQLRQIQALSGSFVSKLPNAAFIDFENPFIGIDFQQKTEGFECPWGNVQLAIIYDTLRTPQPPRTMPALEDWVRAHPGKFTIPYEFTGMTVLKSWLIALAGSPQALNGPFNEARYDSLSHRLWEFINRNKIYFWRKGETFPETLAAMHQMFANGELDFTFSNNDNEVENKIKQGVFPQSARAYVFDSGTIQNSHYLGIPAGAQNPAGAMVAANFLISPEAQWRKMDPAIWGDGTVLAVSRLPNEWQQKFREKAQRKFAPPRDVIDQKALQEPAPEYMIRLYADFRKFVLNSGN